MKTITVEPWRWFAYWRADRFEGVLGHVIIRVATLMNNLEYGLEIMVETDPIPRPDTGEQHGVLSTVCPENSVAYSVLRGTAETKFDTAKQELASLFALVMWKNAVGDSVPVPSVRPFLGKFDR